MMKNKNEVANKAVANLLKKFNEDIKVTEPVVVKPVVEVDKDFNDAEASFNSEPYREDVPINDGLLDDGVEKVPGKTIEEVVVPVMDYIDNAPEFSYFTGRSPILKGKVTLRRFIKGISKPKGKNKELLDAITVATKSGDKQLKSKLKEQLTTFTIPTRVTYRNYDSVQNYTGIVVIDFDGFDDRYETPMQEAIEFKQLIFDSYDSIICCWVSPSAGVKALVRIPICKTKEEYETYAFGIGAEFQIFKGFDPSGLIAVQACFIGGDPNILVRENPTVWKGTGNKPGASFKNGNKTKTVQINKLDDSIKHLIPDNYFKTDDEYKVIVAGIFIKGVENIDVYTEVHPQIRDLCYALGGYVGGGYISEDDAINLMNNTMDNNLDTFIKHDSNGDIYRETGVQAIENGQDYPIELK